MESNRTPFVLRDVSSDCFQRLFIDTTTNILNGFPGYATFFTSITVAVVSRYASKDRGFPVLM